jgi:hypothetical protein
MEDAMTGKIAPKDNSSNMQNANKGTSGTNRQYDQAQGNRGTQMNKTSQHSSTVDKSSGKK